MKALLAKRSAIYILLASLFIISAAASYFRTFESYELGSLDVRFMARFPKIPVSDKVAIIEIGEDTLNKLGRFPFDRSYHAIAVKALSEFGARMIIFDILFSEPQEHDKELADAISEAGNVYLPYAFNIDGRAFGGLIDADGYIARLASGLEKSAKATGHINIVPDIDGKFRRVPLYIKYKDMLHPYISMKAACDYLDIADKDIRIAPAGYISLGGKTRIGLDDRSDMIVNFSGRWGSSYKHYSFVDLLQSYAYHTAGQPPIIDPVKFKDKICIIGLTAAGTGDIHPSPFEALYPGVGIHADIINSILNKKFITRAPKDINILILMLFGALVSFLTMRTKPLAGLMALTGALSLFAAIAVSFFDIYGIWIDAACPVITMGAIYLSCTLYKYIGEWKSRLILENELGIARQIQESFLPKALPETAWLDISAAMSTAKQVGGDLYDFIEFEPGRLGVMIGDVSGKGIPASLFMAMVSGAFKFFAATGSEPADTLSGLNAKLVKESSSGLFVTIFYAVLDINKKAVSFANGGHLPALFLRLGEEQAFLDTTDGAPLGLMEGAYSTGKSDIRKGDIIVFYTDGITEAMNRKREMYEKERLIGIVRKNAHLPSRDILVAIKKDVEKFEQASGGQHDDITIITVKII